MDNISEAMPNDELVETKPEQPDNTGDVKADAAKKDITGYTATLWKYLDIPQNEPEPFPEYLVKSEKYSKSSIIAARVRGKKHKHEGTNCDDWFETASAGDVTFIAVSDGAGSKKLSRIGARESCRTMVGYLKHTFENKILNDPNIMSELSLELSKCMDSCKSLVSIVQEAFCNAYHAVETALYSRVADDAYADLLGRSITIEDFSATLLAAVVIPLGQKGHNDEKLIISCQVGDGMIAIINTSDEFENSVKLMGEPDSGEFSGETDFLVSEKMRRPENIALRTKIYKGSSDILMLMTDGVADDYFPNDTQMHRLYFDMLANGILCCNDDKVSLNNLSEQQMEMFANIPKPAIYPWVNDKEKLIGLNYTKRICQEMNLTLDEIWNDPSVLVMASIYVKKKIGTEEPSERLKIWLDNYVERGSFDDRTLVIALI